MKHDDGFQLHEYVRLKRSFWGIPRGTVGIVRYVYESALVIEFFHQSTMTERPTILRKVEKQEIPNTLRRARKVPFEVQVLTAKPTPPVLSVGSGGFLFLQKGFQS